MLRRWLVLIGVLGALGLAPAVHAQSDGSDQNLDAAAAPTDSLAASGPSLDCNFVGVRTLLDNGLVAHLVCHVADAATRDSSFSVGVVDDAMPVCSVALNAGMGSCVGGLFDPRRQLTVTATLESSGTRLGPLTIAASAPVPQQQAPMQFFPLGD